MTREATKEFVRQHSSLRDRADNWNWLIDKIYDDFEEELKKAYIEGGLALRYWREYKGEVRK